MSTFIPFFLSLLRPFCAYLACLRACLILVVPAKEKKEERRKKEGGRRERGTGREAKGGRDSGRARKQ